MSSYPAHWVMAKGTTVFEFVTSGSRGWAQHYAPTGAKFIRIGNLDHDSITLDLRDVQHVNPPSGAEGERTRLRSNDVLISITAELGMVGVVPSDFGEAYINQHIALARPRTDIHAKFVAWYFASEADGKKALKEMGRGGTKVGLGLDDIRNAEVPLAPLPEQQRIADKLDTVLARVGAVNDRLARVAPLLKRFRQAVLAAATSGRLTADWRMAASSDETSLGHSALEGWQKRSLKELGTVSTGSTPSKKESSFFGGPVPFVKPGDLDKGTITCTEDTLTELGAQHARCVRSGAVFVSCIGNLGKIGRAALPSAFNQQINAIEFFPELMLDEFGYYACMTLAEWLRRNASATTIAIVNKGRFEQAVLNVPPLDEQAEIVRRVEILFAYADRLEARLQAAQAAIARLTPSLLAKAFRGELLPQDPADEPASDLLKRLAVAAPHAPAKRGRQRAATTP